MSKRSEAESKWQVARRRMEVAAEMLAYDVVFRAEDPYEGQHDKPDAALTRRLKDAYREAHKAEEAAYGTYQNTPAESDAYEAEM
jgi:hypothetical protein